MNRNFVLKRPQSMVGIATSLYMTLAYLAGIIIFIVVLRYPAITEDIDKVKIIIEMRTMVFLTNLIMYVFFGPVLILFILFLKSMLDNSEIMLVRFSAITGFIWAGSLTASGMIANGAIEPITRLFSDNPDQAIYLWQMLDTVSMSLGNANGEILGGLMTLGFGLAMLKGEHFSRGLGVFGIIVGAIGIISLIPALVDLAVVFALLQLVWFVLTAFFSVRIIRGASK
ncbi:MAG: hypothetical protein JEZ04_13750 [Spirochaetales bacterium]|nr:hypothetical protein [Spirochaetales bacterium]